MKKYCCYIGIFLCLLLFGGCNDAKKQESQKELSGVTINDSLGYKVTVPTPKRVAVCMGSLADLWQLAGGEIYAATTDVFHYLPLNDGVKDIGDLKRPSVEEMIQQQVDFCILSANLSGQVKLRDILVTAGITPAYFNVETFEDYLQVLKKMTQITGRNDLYETYGVQVKQQVEMQKSRASDRTPKVLLLRAMTTGVKAKNSDTMTGQMLKDLGCINIADSKENLLETLSVEQIVTENPDYIFITFMGDEEKCKTIVQKQLYENPAWSSLTAVKEGHCYILEKELFHYKPNEKWAESYKRLADLLYGQ